MMDWSLVKRGTIISSAVSDALMACGTYLVATSIVRDEPYAMVGYGGILIGAILKYTSFSSIRRRPGRAGEFGDSYNKTI